MAQCGRRTIGWRPIAASALRNAVASTNATNYAIFIQPQRNAGITLCVMPDRTCLLK